MSLVNTFPEFSDGDDEFLPFPDDDNDDSDGWPEFDEAEWGNFSHSRIVRITAIPSDEDRNDVDDDTREDPNILTLSRMALSSMAASGMTVSDMAGATMELSNTLRPTTPTKMRRLRKKLPMLLCKSSRMKQPSPGDKRIRFANHREEGDIHHETRDIILPRQLDFFHEHEAKQVSRPIYRETRDIILPRQLEIFNERPTQVSRPTGGQELCFQGSPVEAYPVKCSPSNWMHTANLFHDKTFPSNTLDFFCRDSALAKVSDCEEETVSSSSSSNAPSLPGGVVDEKLAHVFGLSSIHEDMPNYDFSTQANKGSFTSRTIHDVPASSIALDTTEVNVSSEPRPRVQEKPAAVVKSFTHLRPSGRKIADRQRWLNGAFQCPEVNKDSLLTESKAKVTDKISSNVTGTIETFGNKDSLWTDSKAKVTPKTGSNMTETIEKFGSKVSFLMDSKAKVMDTAKLPDKTSLNVTGTIEKFGNKDSLLTDKAKVTNKTSSNVTETIETFGDKDSLLTDKSKGTDKASSNVTGINEASGNKDSLLTDSKAKVMDTPQMTPKTSSNVAGTIEMFGNKDSLLTVKVKVTPKTSSNVTETIEKFGNKDSLLTDKAKVVPKTSSNVTGTIETFGNKDSFLTDKAKVTPKTSSNVTGTIEKFGGKMTRQSAVQLRKQELERKVLLKNETLKNEGKPCFKTRWEGRPGAYKKKVVLSTYGK